MTNFYQRASRLIAFLRSERRHRRILETERFDLELTLITAIIGVMMLLHFVPLAASVFLYLFFLPVTASAFYLGRHRAGLASTLCILSTVFVFVGGDWAVTPYEFSTWACVLVLSSLCIGTLSDELYGRFTQVYETHFQETLTDVLTNVANRRAFDQQTERNLDVWRQESTPFCLAIVDIDHFKRTNDTYGHQTGDKMLHDVARNLEAAVRPEDKVARYGGEEFAIIMPDISLEQAAEVAEQVRADIEATRFFFERTKIRLRVSIGVAEVQSDDDAQSLIRRADDALYTSKQVGRNCVHLHTGTRCELFGQRSTPVKDAPEQAYEEPQQPRLLDPVTNLPSREVFVGELSRRICESSRYDCRFAVAMVKVDPLTELLAAGKSAHDRGANIIGELISGVMRETDLVVRYSNESFAILMPFTSSAQAQDALKRLEEEVVGCTALRHNGRALNLRSIGSVCEPEEGDTASSVIAYLQDQLIRREEPSRPDLGEECDTSSIKAEIDPIEPRTPSC